MRRALCANILAIFGGCTAVISCSGTGVKDEQATSTQEGLVSTPSNPNLSTFAIYAQNSISVGDQPPNSGNIVDGGDIGVASSVSASTLSPGYAISLGARAKVDTSHILFGHRIHVGSQSEVGPLATDQLVNDGSSRIGAVSPLGPMPSLPAAAPVSPGAGAVTANGSNLPPGKYGDVVVPASQRLFLTGGLYEFASLTLGDSASLGGLAPSTVRVAGRLLSGDSVHVTPQRGGTARDLTIEVSGSNGTSGPLGTPSAATIGSRTELHALVLVPNGTLQIGDSVQATGAFFGRDVQIGHSHVVFESGFPKGPGCTTLASCNDFNDCTTDACTSSGCTHTAIAACGAVATCGSDGTTCPSTITRIDSPVVLSPRRHHDTNADEPAEATTTTAVPFEIPTKLPVSAGNAANGVATFSYRDLSNNLVTCTYRGKSTVPIPHHDLDRALGRFYFFESCSNGAKGGDAATGRYFAADVLSGDTSHPAGVTEVEVHVGPGCGRLDPPIAADESVRIRQAFSWKNTQQLPETDPKGRPSMRYAWIYIENKEQLNALKKMHVFYSSRPIFSADLERYKGKCGRFENDGDGAGMFVFSILPAALYNYFRTASLVVLQQGQGNVPFRAIHLPNVPDPKLVESDGSLSWDQFKASGFSYYGEGSNRDVQQPFLGVDIPFVDNAIDYGESLVDHTVDGAKNLVGAGVDLFTGKPGDALKKLVRVGEDEFEVSFGVAPVMDDLIPAAVKIADETWRLGTKIVGAIDKFFSGSRDITVNLRVLNRDSAFDVNQPMTRGWGAHAGEILIPHGARIDINRWSNAVVIPSSYSADLATDGSVTISIAKGGSARGDSGLCISMENEAAALSAGLLENSFCDFGDLPWLDATGDDTTLYNNAKDKTLRVNDHELHEFSQYTDGHDYLTDVVGHTPKQLEVGTGLVASMVTVTGNSFTPCLDFDGNLSNLVAATNVVLFGPLGVVTSHMMRKDMFIAKNAFTSRGVPTHEYGHFAMCSLIHDASPAALETLYSQRILEKQAPTSRDSTHALQMESFADFFASQVVSGVNYARVSNFSNSADDRMRYCSLPDCTEHNFRGFEPSGSDPFHDEVTRLVSLFHDVVDGSPWRKRGNVPTNSDAWTTNGTPTNPLVFSTAEYQTDIDDAVHLPGSMMRDWVSNAVGSCNSGLFGPFQLSCDFSARRALPALARTMRDAGVNWCDACHLFALHDANAPVSTTATSSVADWTACKTQSSLADIVGAPPGDTVALRASDCSPCAPGQISNAGVCKTCATGEAVDRDQNVCRTCQAGSTIDFGALATNCDWHTSKNLQASGATASDCAGLNIVEVDGLDADLRFTNPTVALTLDNKILDESTCVAAALHTKLQTSSDGGSWTTVASGDAHGQWTSCTPSAGTPLCDPPCALKVSFSLGLNAIRAGASKARFISTTEGSGFPYTVEVSSGNICPPR